MSKQEFPLSPVGSLDRASGEPVDVLSEAREALRIKVLNASQRVQTFDDRAPNQCLAAWRDGTNMTPEFDYLMNHIEVPPRTPDRDEFLERLRSLEREYLGHD